MPSGQDDINFERNQFGRKRGEPLELPLGISVFNHNVAALDVTEVTQSLTEGLVQVGVSGQVGRQQAYSRDLGRRLGLGDQRCGKKCPGGDQEIPALDAVHAPSSLESRRKVYAATPLQDLERSTSSKRSSLRNVGVFENWLVVS